jgi:peptide/nickel transport system substrate-binding protein
MHVRYSLVIVVLAAILAGAPPATAAPDGTLTIGVHVTLVSRWLDPGDTEALITPFMVLYGIHDALVKPMPAGINTPSLAESWSVSKDGIAYEFILRKGIRFHNGDPVTAEDVKFTFDRYKGSGAKLLKDKVKDVQVVAPNRVRFVLKEPWPDFMSFYGTSATGAAWIVPKKHIEKVGEDAFKKTPIGAGPYKIVSFTPGIELVLEAFPDYWRKVPSVKRIVMRSIPDETTRAAAVKTGQVDIGFLFGGAIAEELRRTPGVKIAAPLVYGIYWLDFLDQWDPKSPWHDQRVRLAASLAIDRQAINQAEMLGYGKLTGSFVPSTFEFALPIEVAPFDPKRAKQLMVEAGYANGFDAGDLTPLRPIRPWPRPSPAISRPSASAAGCAPWSAPPSSPRGERKRSRGFSSAPPAPRQCRGSARALLHQERHLRVWCRARDRRSLPASGERARSQKARGAAAPDPEIVADRVLVAPLYQQAFPGESGSRVEESTAGLVQGFPYTGPFEDLKVK